MLSIFWLVAVGATCGSAAVASLHACVPADTRPVPGSLLVTVSRFREAGPIELPSDDFDGRPIVIASVGDYLYEILMPSVPRFRDVGTCSVDVHLRGSPDAR